MRIVFFGTPAFAVPILSGLAECHEIVAVVTQPDRPKNRGHKLVYSEVKQEALKMELKVLQPVNIEAAEIPEADVYVVVAYGQIFPERLLNSPKYGCLNVHASLLPKYRGAAPIQRAIENGDPITGVCIMKMENGLDTGDVLLSGEVEIADMDAVKLSEVLSKIGAKKILEALEQIEAGTVKYMKQGDDFTYAKKITKADFELEFEKTYEQNVRKIRAFGYIKTMLDGKNVKIFKLDDCQSGEESCGFVCDKTDEACILIQRGQIFIQFSDRRARVLELQPENSKRMSAKSYLLGRR